MKTLTYISLLTAAAAVAGAAGQVEITGPADGATLEGGHVVDVTWKNSTTVAADVYVLVGNKRQDLVTDNAVDRGTSKWRVPKDEGSYTLVVEAANGAKASVTVFVGAAGEPETAAAGAPKIYPSPNPLDLSAGAAAATFAGAPAGAKVTIYDLEGLKVAERDNDPLSWDGRNERGDVVAGGTYMYVLETPGGEKFTGKLAVVK